MARPSRAAYVVAVVALAATIAVGATLGAGASSRIAAIPESVSRELGPAPLILTLHGSLLAMLSAPGVDELAALEARIAVQPHVGGEYGPVTWLRARLSRIAEDIGRHVSSRLTRADLLVRYGASGSLSIDDQSLVTTLVFGARIAPQPGVRWLFPDADRVRIFVRTTGRAIGSTIHDLEQLVAGSGLQDVSTTVSQGG
jgi:hypothetical protein